MRNKAKNFPAPMKFDGEPKAKPVYSSKRANGTINTNPEERMRRSGERVESP